MNETPAARPWPAWILGAVLGVAVIAAYWNSLGTPFVFDDLPAIVDNPSIRSLWQPEAPPRAGSAVVGRPVVNFSFAVNYALGGLDVRGYHAANLLIHLAAALLLAGIVRRTLRSAGLPEGLRAAARPVGFSAALLWALHPLQTESVTGIVQRTESLGGLIYLAALYGFVRATEPGARAPGRWLGVCVVACLTGMATKETTATLPLVILLYDRAFVAGSFRAAGRRWWFYGLLALTWLLLAALMRETGGRGGTVTLGRDVTAGMSLVTQSRAVAMYLQLAVWPHPLVLDYGDFVTETVIDPRAVWPQLLLVSALGCAAVYGLIRWPRAGFAGAWFFILLAPSSSFIPLLSQMRAEHRMYLPLVAVVVPLVILVWRGAGRAAPGIIAALAVALGTGTVLRNHDYRTVLALWSDTVQKQPGNPRAHYNLGRELARGGDRAGARREYTAAVQLKPVFFDAHVALAGLLVEEGETAAAQPHLAAAIELGPENSATCNSLGHVLLLAGDAGRAAGYFAAALQHDPDNHEAHNNLGYVLAAEGRLEEAIGHFRRSVALHPGAAALRNLGDALRQAGRPGEALPSLAEAVRLQPGEPEAHFSLANALAAVGRSEEALAEYERVTAAEPGHLPAWFNQGIMQRRLGQTAGARASFERVLTLDPANAAAARQLEALGPP